MIRGVNVFDIWRLQNGHWLGLYLKSLGPFYWKERNGIIVFLAFSAISLCCLLIILLVTLVLVELGFARKILREPAEIIIPVKVYLEPPIPIRLNRDALRFEGLPLPIRPTRVLSGISTINTSSEITVNQAYLGERIPCELTTLCHGTLSQ